MNQKDRRTYLIERLLEEQRRYSDIKIPVGEQEQKDLLRSLMNVREPSPVSGEFIKIQDEYLQEAIKEKGVTSLSELDPIEGDIYLWQGDITTLAVDAIVNAANSGMTGCYRPLHYCIDNCIHTFAGIQLRNTCDEMMQQQGVAEPTGKAKITPAYNLPCKYVLHTVGPIVTGRLNDTHRKLLASCYDSCLKLAEENGVKSIAFCCISTGVFGYPHLEAAQTAIQTVKEYKAKTNSEIKVIFNVFKDEDYCIYRRLLG